MADTMRSSTLAGMAGSMPVANRRIAQQQQAARDIQLQQAARTAPSSSYQVANQLGAASAQNAGEQQVAQVQQAAGQQGQVAQTGLADKANSIKNELSQLQQGAADQQMANVEKLANVSEAAKKELYDSRMQFNRDEMGREFLNNRQLDDFAAQRAKSDEDFLNYQQNTKQLSDKKLSMLSAVQQKLEQELADQNKLYNQALDQSNNLALSQEQRAAALAQKEQLEQARIDTARKVRALQESAAREQAEAANRQARQQAIGSTLGAVGGGVAGFIFGGGPMGAAAGASAGSALGGGLTTALSGGIKL